MTAEPKNTQEKFPVYMEDQRRFFDELITTEWQTYQSQAWNLARQYEVDRIFERVSAQRILDVGCGCGYHDVLMAEKPGVGQVTGIDYSEQSVAVANREYPHPKVERHVANLFELPAGDYDLTVSFQVIEHLTDAVAFLRACARQVHAGGWVAAATPNRSRLLNRLLPLAGRAPVLADPQHFREYNAAEMRAMVAAAGLEWQTTFGYGLSFVVPKLRCEIVPQRYAAKLGGLVPGIADLLCVVARKPAQS
jgi:2-polyprenyl-3-methyl-5-hydroxy-6-metoxy-1,4-benzoquinol methylase